MTRVVATRGEGLYLIEDADGAFTFDSEPYTGDEDSVLAQYKQLGVTPPALGA